MKLKHTTIAFCAAALVSVWATSAQAQASRAEVKTFLDGMLKSHNQLFAAGQKFGESIAPVLQDQDYSLLSINQTFRKAAQTLGTVRADTKKATVPDHPLARKLAEQNNEFLDVQASLILETLPKIVEVIEDETLTPEQRKARIQSELESGLKTENDIGDRLRETFAELQEQYQIE